MWYVLGVYLRTLDAGYWRTQIRGLRVSGFRGLRSVDLADLPDIVVLHGPNGAGKSSLMRAVELIVRWLGNSAQASIPDAEHPSRLGYAEARDALGIDRDDFCRGAGPEIRIRLEIELGTRAGPLMRAAAIRRGRVVLEAVVRDLGEEAGISHWFESSTLHSDISVNTVLTEEYFDDLLARSRSASDAGERAALSEQFHREYVEFEGITRLRNLTLGTSAERHHLRHLLEIGGAYRRIVREPILGGSGEAASDALQTQLRRASMSRETEQYRFWTSLPSLLADAGLFDGKPARFRPSDDEVYNETSLLVSTEHHDDLPISHLGTGEQQLIAMVTSMCLRGAPIVLIQEPEAHLYRDAQLKLAGFLRRSVHSQFDPPRFDQLWIETHHHAFALAPEYLDVSLDDQGYTRVERRPRIAAQGHFYEPGPVLDALKQLVEDQKQLNGDSVVFHNGAGTPVTAGEILASLDGDQEVAQQYTEAVTRTVVRLLEKATRGNAP